MFHAIKSTFQTCKHFKHFSSVNTAVTSRLPDLVSQYEALLGGSTCDILTGARAMLAYQQKNYASAQKILQEGKYLYVLVNIKLRALQAILHVGSLYF